MTEHPEMEFVQLQINYLDWESEGVQSRKCYEVAVKHGVPVIVMEPVKGGTLAQVPENVESLLRVIIRICRFRPGQSVLRQALTMS